MPNTPGTGGPSSGGSGGSTAPGADAGPAPTDVRRDTLSSGTPDTRPPDMRGPISVTPGRPPDASPAPPDMMTALPPDMGPSAMLPPPPPPPADAGPGAPLTPCSGGCPGLRGEYFDNDDFTGSKFVRQDERVDFVWEDKPPDPSMERDAFSVRWVGKIRPRFSESYTFSVEANDNVRLWVAGRQLLNVFDNTGRRTTDASIELKADQAEDIVIEFRERSGDAQITVSWRSNSQNREVVPATALFWMPGPAPP